MPETITLGVGAILVLVASGCFTQLKQAARFSVLDSDTACGETSEKALEIELLASKPAGRATIKLNGSNSSWESISPTLRELYSGRKDKYVYLRTEPDVSSAVESEMFHLIESANTERLCLLDFKAPHKYLRQSLSGR